MDDSLTAEPAAVAMQVLLDEPAPTSAERKEAYRLLLTVRNEFGLDYVQMAEVLDSPDHPAWWLEKMLTRGGYKNASAADLATIATLFARAERDFWARGMKPPAARVPETATICKTAKDLTEAFEQLVISLAPDPAQPLSLSGMSKHFGGCSVSAIHRVLHRDEWRPTSEWLERASESVQAIFSIDDLKRLRDLQYGPPTRKGVIGEERPKRPLKKRTPGVPRNGRPFRKPKDPLASPLVKGAILYASLHEEMCQILAHVQAAAHVAKYSEMKREVEAKAGVLLPVVRAGAGPALPEATLPAMDHEMLAWLGLPRPEDSLWQVPTVGAALHLRAATALAEHSLARTPWEEAGTVALWQDAFARAKAALETFFPTGS